LLIAALASLSTLLLLEVDPPDDFEDDLEEPVLGDFAIAFLSLRRVWKDTLET
jgi:hypothetical protein